jgi:glycosyltransferase involved in cell wall biosynthesis
MRVLWFTNYPSLGSGYLHENYQPRDWVASLQKQIEKSNNIELGLAFHYKGNKKKKFKLGSTFYFALPKFEDKNKIKRVLNRWSHKIEPDYYLEWYIEIINAFKPDIIHIFGTEQPFGLISDRVNIPIIIQIQGNLTVCSKKWFSGLSPFDVFRHSSFISLIRASGLWHDYFTFIKKAKREQEIFKYGKLFIGRTTWDRRIVSTLSTDGRYYHCDELLRDIFHQQFWSEPANKIIVLVSTLSPAIYKGIETILETASILKNKRNINFEWQVIGLKGNEELVNIIEKKYKLKFSEQNIRFKGSLNAESLADSLLNSNIYIHPSHIENSPNSLCEAMLLGMPIIATYAGGTPTIVKDKEEGLLVQDGDPYALTGAIIELSNSKDYAFKLGSNARKIAIERHNPEKVMTSLLSIYNSISARIQ